MNGVGLHVNEKFGFGLLDSERVVSKADPKTWRNVPASRECRGKSFSEAKYVRIYHVSLTNHSSSVINRTLLTLSNR